MLIITNEKVLMPTERFVKILAGTDNMWLVQKQEHNTVFTIENQETGQLYSGVFSGMFHSVDSVILIEV